MKDKIIQLRKQGFSYSKISTMLGCTKSTVSYHIGKRTNKPKGNGKCLICKCGGKKSHNSVMCQSCRSEDKLRVQEERTLFDIALKGNARVKWSSLRELAKRKLTRLRAKKCCAICGFDIVVDCCHIKPINSFSKNSLVKEVNSVENLIYLCPNHHKMLDKGFIKIKDLPKQIYL